ncbi:MAG TPA: Uma2 family endonuclease [Kofleriaceae bacterium]|nr:Uma2 family endonuclease [Kofleriaceae bacterium]
MQILVGRRAVTKRATCDRLEQLDRAEKLPIYARAEVRHAWLVDPVLRTLEVLRLERGRWVLLDTYHDDARVRAEPFEVFELELDVLWAGVQLADPPR